MSFNDIFKSDFLENVTSVGIGDMLLALGLSFCLGLFILFIYKKTYAGVMYSASFGVTLLGLTMITTMVILAVTSNVVLSLGMVGALSIVRFRTAIKEPTDLVFLFWAIAAGIVLAAGMLPLAIIGSIIIGVILLLFANRKVNTRPYILSVRCANTAAENSVAAIVTADCEKSCLKSKSVRSEQIDLNYEVRLKDNDQSFVNKISAVAGVSSAVLVSYNGEYMG